MTKEQKQAVNKLRNEGLGYTKIAQSLGVSENTVKSFCRRNNLTSDDVSNKEIQNQDGVHYCQCCGKEVSQMPGKKEKRFCSDKCRNKWWNSHLDQVKRTANYNFICPHCKKTFMVYGNAGRKYCSHECYIADRFGGKK